MPSRSSLLTYGYQGYEPYVLAGALSGTVATDFTDDQIQTLIAEWLASPATHYPPGEDGDAPRSIVVRPSDRQVGDVPTWNGAKWAGSRPTELLDPEGGDAYAKMVGPGGSDPLAIDIYDGTNGVYIDSFPDGFLNYTPHNEVTLKALTSAGVGAGPHLIMDTGIGTNPSEHWYTEVVSKFNHLHKHAQGFEHFDATHEHYFFDSIVSDDGAGTLVFKRNFSVEIGTGRMVFNPDPTSTPHTYPTLIDMRSDTAALPVLRLTGHTSQTSDLAEFYKGATKKAGVNAGGAFVSDTAAAGVVLKDAQATPHYWRVTVSNTGVLTTADLGATRPTS